MTYVAILEPIGANFSAYLPDVPGCVATGRTREATRRNLTTALALHIAGLREDGLPVPEPVAIADLVDLA